MIAVNVRFEMVLATSVGHAFCHSRGRWEDVDNKWKDAHVVVFWCTKTQDKRKLTVLCTDFALLRNWNSDITQFSRCTAKKPSKLRS